MGYIGIGKKLRDAMEEDKGRLDDSQVLEVFQQKLDRHRGFHVIFILYFGAHFCIIMSYNYSNHYSS